MTTVEKCAEICARPWKKLAPNMNELTMEHIPVKSTQKEMFSFINELMKIRSIEITEKVKEGYSHLYKYALIVVLFTTASDVAQFRFDGWDSWHIIKWVFFLYLFVREYVKEHGWYLPTFRDTGLILFWMVVITVGLHEFILHYLF